MVQVYTTENRSQQVATIPSTTREGSIVLVKEELLDQQNDFLHVPINRQKSISPPPKYDIQHQATCFFLNLFSFQAKKIYGAPVLDFLPDMLEESKDNMAIQQASRAVARMTLADRYSGSDIRLQTSNEYAKALKSVAETMTDEQEMIKDELITAVWLLGLYEVCFP